MNKAAETKAYATEAAARWGDTAAYREYKEKTAGQSEAELQDAGAGLMAILAGFGAMQERSAATPEVQSRVQALRDYITAHFYTCTKEILAGLGQLYAADGEYAENIDRAGGAGTACFAAEAIRHYCKN